jgi:multiple sugar transport system permease protein
MMRRRQVIAIHAVLLTLAVMVYLPFALVINNSFRTNAETYHSFFGVPRAFKELIGLVEAREPGAPDAGAPEAVTAADVGDAESVESPGKRLLKGYVLSWAVLRRYMLNALFVSGLSAFGTVLLGSLSAYVFSRYRFAGRNVLFAVMLSTMMVPGILTLTPAYLWMKGFPLVGGNDLYGHGGTGLLNSYWVLILPYIAGGQVFAVFVCRSFFASLPEDLFESARIDGAGHFSIYCNIVLPLSMPVLSVVAVMNILSTWNNFLWPFVTNSDDRYHVIASGLYIMSASQVNTNQATMNAAYLLASIPLLVLFIYATKPFMRGVTTGALKA